MLEQKQDRNKQRIEKRIFKWIGLGLLVLLLIASLIFQAPWKVITLLVIILAACTILPKPFRKWFWLSAAAIVVAFIIWALLPEDDEGWRTYTFDEELAVLEAKYAIPDEENAASIYNELLKSYDSKTMHPDFLDRELDKLTLSEPWSSQKYPHFAQWLKGHESTIKTLMQAVQKKRCRFPINVQPVVTDELEVNRLSALKNWGLLLIRTGNNDIAEGRTDQALKKYICALRIASHLYQCQRMLDISVGFYIEELALIQLERFVVEGEPTNEQMQMISDLMTDLQNNWSSDFDKGLKYDRLYWKNAFGLFYEINNEGQIRLSGNPALVMRNLFYRRRLGRYFRDKQFHRIYAVLAWFFLPSTPQKIAKIVETTIDRYRPMSQPDFNWLKEPDKPDMRFQLNYPYMVKAAIIEESEIDRYYRFFHDKYLEHIALRRGLRLLIAIRQCQLESGAWPPNLGAIRSSAPAEAFIDPAGGNEFEYENHGERFSLFGETANIWPK